MHPIDQYVTIQRGLEELRRQAEQERMARAARLKKLSNQKFYRQLAHWLGTHMVKWGHELEQFGTLKQLRSTSASSPHH